MFLNEQYLILLAIVPFLLLLSLVSALRRERALQRLGQADLILALTNRTNRIIRNLRNAFWILGFTLLLLALARPSWGTIEETTTVRGVSIIVLLDISVSMDADDIKPSRLERARLTLRDLLNNLDNNHQVGLVVFAGAPYLYLPLTTDIHTAELFLERVNTSLVATAGTSVGPAIELALNAFPTEGDEGRLLFVLSDGEYHGVTADDEAQQAAEANTPIHAIGYGTEEGGSIPDADSPDGVKLDANGEPVTTRLDEFVLTQITEITGGTYRRVDVGGREVAFMLDMIEQASAQPIDDVASVRRLEQYGWFALGAFLCLALAWALPEGRRK